MNDLNISMGKRLNEIRKIFNEGYKLTISQFAHLMGETKDRMANYESGRSAIPNHLLLNLYRRGINPVYILSGEGTMYANTIAGKELEQKIGGITSELNQPDLEKTPIDILLDKAQHHTAAAGNIWEIIRKKRLTEQLQAKGKRQK